MARGKKSASKETGGVWNFVVRDASKNEEGKIPNFVYEGIIGIVIADTRSLEIVRLKNMKVTVDNITSISKQYSDKYQIGDEYQEWCSLYGTVGCYPTTLAGALRIIKDIAINNEISKTKSETDFNKIFAAIQEVDDKILKCLKTDIVPKSADIASKLVKDMQKSMDEIELINKKLADMTATCDAVSAELKEHHKAIPTEKGAKKKK